MFSKEEILNLMASSKNGKEWDENADKVKKDGGGQYPTYWYQEVIIPYTKRGYPGDKP